MRLLSMKCTATAGADSASCHELPHKGLTTIVDLISDRSRLQVRRFPRPRPLPLPPLDGLSSASSASSPCCFRLLPLLLSASRIWARKHAETRYAAETRQHILQLSRRCRDGDVQTHAVSAVTSNINLLGPLWMALLTRQMIIEPLHPKSPDCSLPMLSAVISGPAGQQRQRHRLNQALMLADGIIHDGYLA